MIYFLLLNFLVFISAHSLTKRIFKLNYIYDYILGVFTLFLACVVFSTQLLGLSNILELKWLLILSFFITSIILFVTKNRDSKVIVSDKGFTEVFLGNKVAVFCLAGIVGFGLVKIFINLINPPFGWDSLNYHFTFPVEWLKNKSFLTPPTICDDPTPTYYPINGGIFYFWLIAPFKDVFIADLGQLPFLIICFFAIISLSRKLGISKEFSFYAASLFVIMPNVFKNIEIGYTDIFVVALFLTALNFLYNLHESFTPENITLLGISLGLLLGTKTAGLPYVSLLILFSLYLLYYKRRETSFIKLCLYALVLISLIICFGSFGYIRNFIITGNPLYPFPLKFFGRIIFAGPMPKATYNAHWSSQDFNIVKLLFREGFGPQLVLLIVPAMFLAPILAVKKGLKKYNLIEKFIFVLPIVIYLIFRYSVPQLWVRFLYPFMAVGMITAVYVVYRLNIPRRIIKFLVVISILASIAELSGHTELIVSLVLTVFCFFVIPILLRWFIGRRRLLILSVCAFSGFIIFVLTALRVNYLDNEFKRYISNTVYGKEITQGWDWVNENTKADNIAYSGRPLVFPLYGSKLKNNVYYVSVNSIEPAWLHRFKDARLIWDRDYHNLHNNLAEDINYRGKANILVWKKNLSLRNINYLVVYPLHQTDIFPIEDTWAKNNPNNFKLVFSNSQIHVYKVYHY